MIETPKQEKVKTGEALKPAPEKGDEILRRMLKTPPKPHNESQTKKENTPSRTGKKPKSE